MQRAYGAVVTAPMTRQVMVSDTEPAHADHMTSISLDTTSLDTTSLTGPPTTVRAERSRQSAARRLRAVLSTNAITSAAVGVVATIAPGAVDEVLGTGHAGWIRLIGGVSFIVFAAVVSALARSAAATRARYAPLVSALDTSYVLGVIVTIAAGWYSTTGSWVMAGTAALVADFAIGQVWFARRSR